MPEAWHETPSEKVKREESRGPARLNLSSPTHVNLLMRFRHRIASTKSSSSYSVPLSYVQGVSEQLARVFRKQEVGTYHIPFNTIRQQLVYPKDPTPKEKELGVVYKVQRKDCKEDYIGETARPFRIRFMDHDNIRRASTTAVGDARRDMGHTLDFSSSLIIARENDTFKRRIREAIEIHCQAPTLNCDNGYELPVIYRNVLSCGFHHPKSRQTPSLAVFLPEFSTLGTTGPIEKLKGVIREKSGSQLRYS